MVTSSRDGSLVVYALSTPDVVALLTRVQNELFDVGADLSTPVVSDPPWPPLRWGCWRCGAGHDGGGRHEHAAHPGGAKRTDAGGLRP